MNNETYDTSVAAQKLVSMLNAADDYKVTRKVGRFINHYARYISGLNDINCIRTRRKMSDLLRTDIIYSELNVPKKIETFTRNVCIGKLRRFAELNHFDVKEYDSIKLEGDEFDFDKYRL